MRFSPYTTRTGPLRRNSMPSPSPGTWVQYRLSVITGRTVSRSRTCSSTTRREAAATASRPRSQCVSAGSSAPPTDHRPGPLRAFYERIATMFTGHDLPDETLVRACLDSYRSPASTPERLASDDDLLRRSQDHAGLIADLVEGGHRLGMRVWIA